MNKVGTSYVAKPCMKHCFRISYVAFAVTSLPLS